MMYRDSQQRTQSSVRELAKTSESTDSNFSKLITMLGSIPKDAGYTWDGGKLKHEANITLVWATGEQVLVPLDFWKSFKVKLSFTLLAGNTNHYQTLHDFLLLKKDYPGHKRLLRNHYRLTDCSNGVSLDAGDFNSWHKVARPGGKVMMSIVLGTWEKWRSTGDYCPKCGSDDIKDAVFSGWRQWYVKQTLL
jgi:hypothetical protein